MPREIGYSEVCPKDWEFICDGIQDALTVSCSDGTDVVFQQLVEIYLRRVSSVFGLDGSNHQGCLNDEQDG